MATPKKPSGWNSLSKAQQDAWKKKNFNMKVKVTEAQLDKLRAKKTPEKAIAAYKGDPKMREALYRFYGKDRVNKAIGKTVVDSKPKGKNPNVPTGKNNPGKNYIGAGNVANYKTQSRPMDPRGGGNISGKKPQTQGRIRESLDQKYRYKKAMDKRTDQSLTALSLVVPVARGAKLANTAYKTRLAAKAVEAGGKRVKGAAETVAKATKTATKNGPKRALPKGSPKPNVTPPRTRRMAPKTTIPRDFKPAGARNRKTGRGD